VERRRGGFCFEVPTASLKHSSLPLQPVEHLRDIDVALTHAPSFS
jgi:hypothetical protein